MFLTGISRAQTSPPNLQFNWMPIFVDTDINICFFDKVLLTITWDGTIKKSFIKTYNSTQSMGGGHHGHPTKHCHSASTIAVKNLVLTDFSCKLGLFLCKLRHCKLHKNLLQIILNLQGMHLIAYWPKTITVRT